MKKLVNNPEKELNKANELLRRVYDIIEIQKKEKKRNYK